MAIYTSRYNNKALLGDGYYPVGISLGAPKFKLGYEVREQCYSLAPKGAMLHLPYDQYKTAYMAKLDAIGRDRIICMVQRMEERADEECKDLVLLCFEDIRKPEEWCHRRLFAEWWMNNTGEIIDELEDPTPPKMAAQQITEEPKAEAKPAEPEEGIGEQMSLFRGSSARRW